MSNWHCPFIYHVHIESRCKIIKGYFIPRRNLALNTSWSVGTQKNYIDGSKMWLQMSFLLFDGILNQWILCWSMTSKENCFFTLEYCLKYLTLLFCHLHTHPHHPASQCRKVEYIWQLKKSAQNEAIHAFNKLCTKIEYFVTPPTSPTNERCSYFFVV